MSNVKTMEENSFDSKNVADVLISAIKKMKYFKWSKTSNSFIQYRKVTSRKKFKRVDDLLKKRGLYQDEMRFIRNVKPYFAYLLAELPEQKKMCVDFCYKVYLKQLPEGETGDREKYEETFVDICKILEEKIINGVAKTRIARKTRRKR